MKKTAFLIVLLGAAFAGKGQNLVPNGDFELYSGCPNSWAQLYLATNWLDPSNGTPDYYNSCNNIGFFDVPDNISGFQMAHSGGGYAGFIPFVDNLYWREYLEIQLTSTLISNTCYRFEMYLNTANKAQYTTDDIGIYFSDTLISGITNVYALPFTPQIINSTGFITDTLNWTLISGNFTAAGGENYILIGNFKNDQNTNTIVINQNGINNYSYFYIDDVSLTPCTTGIEEQNESAAIKIYPNPVKDELTVSSNLFGEKTEIIITDVLGKEIYRNQITGSNFKFQVSNFQPGIYFIEINNGKNVYRKKFLKQ